MKSRVAGVAAILLLLTAFTVARLQAQNEEISLETIIADFKAMTALVGRSVSGGT